MKIICNQKEFAALVRECYSGCRDERCAGCPFRGICSSGREEFYDGELMSRIEDLCEIEVEPHG